jgi:flagellin-like hook-associated protein FlgL
MAQTSITLTASMRSNLSSLKSIQKQMDVTQERLSTGKKVNSAIDNPSSFYQARSLTNRAGDLDALLDSMGQGIQTIQAANEGIEAVTAFVEQLKSIATSAYSLDPSLGSYESSIQSYKDQYAEILTEIDNLVKDSSYQGVNLLTGGDLTITFNESRSNRFTIEGDDVEGDNLQA